VEEGPTRTETLARDLLGLTNAPAEVARRVVAQLFDGQDRVTFDDGRWRLRDGGGSAAGAPLEELEYAVVDLETTGMSPDRGHRVTEVAAVEVSGGEVGGGFSTLEDPGRAIPPRVVELTGITDAMVDGAPSFGEVAGRLRGALEGRVFVAHNVPFDWRFLTEEMRRAEGSLPEGPRLCTLRLARRALPGLGSKGLDAVARHYGVEIEGRHRAAGDARATAVVLLRLLEEARAEGIDRWAELERWLSGAGPARSDAPHTERGDEDGRC
jgi:DNA polymerase III epsilon subunit family exonuclease